MMSMPMPTLDVCTLSNIRVASNTHCFEVAALLLVRALPFPSLRRYRVLS